MTESSHRICLVLVLFMDSAKACNVGLNRATMREGRGIALATTGVLCLFIIAASISPVLCRRSPATPTEAAFAAAPAPSKSENHKSHSHASSPSPFAADGPEASPSWANPVSSISEIDNYSDEQLSKLFSSGVAEIPGAETKDKYQLCKGRTLINSWTKGGKHTQFFLSSER